MVLRSALFSLARRAAIAGRSVLIQITAAVAACAQPAAKSGRPAPSSIDDTAKVSKTTRPNIGASKSPLLPPGKQTIAKCVALEKERDHEDRRRSIRRNACRGGREADLRHRRRQPERADRCAAAAR